MKRSFFLLFTAAVMVQLAMPPSAAALHATSYTFDAYLHEYNKKYEPNEYQMRKAIFEERLMSIYKFNAVASRSYHQSVNEMTDWTESELQGLNGAKPRMTHTGLGSTIEQQPYKASGRRAPHSVDHRTAVPPVLTDVKNQGHCGSCWAHSAVEAIESHWAIATGNLHVLSQQQVTSCTENPKHCGGTGGCFGAIESLAYDYVHKAGGLVEEWAYPYTSYYGDSGECRKTTAGVVAKVSSYVKLPSNDQDALMDAVATVGPIAVSVDASMWSTYGGGIFDGCDYAKNISQNHAVQLVGYGHDKESGLDYWVIRNSWGPRWGEGGFMRLLREKNATCGWSVNAHDGSACDGDPDIQWVCGMCGVASDSTFPVVDTS